MAERFTETLRAASEAGWSHAVQHRFVNELFAGAVPDAVMARYLIQDHRFLDSFLVLLGAALASADTFAARLRFGRFIGMVSAEEHLFPSGVRSAWRHRDQARSRSRYAADHRVQGDPARSGGCAQLCGHAFGPRGGRMAVSRLGLPRAAAAAEQLRTRGVDHTARQFEFSWVRRIPAHGIGPCRPGARRSVPRLLFSRCRARTLLFRSRLCDLSSPEDLGTAQAE